MADIFELFKKISKTEEPSGPVTHIIVGLGNPGEEYLRTRHNAGFIAMDYLCRRADTDCKRIKFHSMCGYASIGNHRVLLMKPQTYMNRSGEAVRDAAQFYKISPENIIVLVDDINLAPGHMRIRKSGTDGGHNGLKNIIFHLESDKFPRVRIGVGQKPSKNTDLADWVTEKLSDEKLKIMAPCFEACYDAAALIMDGKADEAMGKYNGMKPGNEDNGKE